MDLVRSLLRVICGYFPRACKLAPKAFFVTCVVTIFHLQTTWLRAVEASMFVFVSNLSVVRNSSDARHRVVVVEIDDLTYERNYRERAPLDRCALTKQLRAIYAAEPEVVAIDLDLSRATWMEPIHPAAQECAEGETTAQCEKWCEDELYRLIEASANPNGKHLNALHEGERVDGVKTVLLEPFEGADLGMRAKRVEWRDRMFEDGGGNIRFADADIPVEFGLALRFPDAPDSLSRIARLATEDCGGNGKCPGLEAGRDSYIDSRSYWDDLGVIAVKEVVSVSDNKFDAQALTDKVRRQLDSLVPLRDGDHKTSRVVFFGGAYGLDDRFQTPIGKLYGVETHAGAYMQRGVHSNEIVDFLLDWSIAILFARYGIGQLWSRYFDARFSGSALRQAVAPLFILRLLLQVIGLLVGLVLLATFMFVNLGLWLSPLALAVGMLFEGFIGAAVEGAIHAHAGGKHSRHPTTVEGITVVEVGDVAIVAARAGRHNETPGKQGAAHWINGTWRMFRWLICGWALLSISGI